MKWYKLFSISLLLLLLYSCKSDIKRVDKDFHFTLLKHDETNIDFNNKLTENDSVNFLTNQYMYIGSGIGIGDFNNDGLP
ncbi:MAG: hypothetical protein M3Z92_04270, partial [Bacteroidota bacterium]|nr:hypothetical protein [Bacteroidota bacterium]